jgi:hypothetical protein
MPKCEVGGCDREVKAHAQCQMHYDRERGRHRKREDRVLPTRARNRAVAALIKEHPEEFAKYLASALAEVQAEHQRIVALAKEQGVEVADARRVFRLKRGPVADDENVEDRAQFADPVQCPSCDGYHESAHACPACAERQRTPDKSPKERIRDLLTAEKSAQWIVNNLGEPRELVLDVLYEMRSEKEQASA